MVQESDLKELLHTPGMSSVSRLLICLAVSPEASRAESALRQMTINAGVANASKLNIATYMKRARDGGFAIKLPTGWELTKSGREQVAVLTKDRVIADPPAEPIRKLRDHLRSIAKPETRAFVEEAVRCAEHQLYRSSVVLSWVGAVAVLHDHVLKNKLTEFNTEATKRSSKWKAATNGDELSTMKEFDFLQILQSISVMGKNVREELEACLKYRNACGHPSSLKIVESRVVAHIETLMANVFESYS